MINNRLLRSMDLKVNMQRINRTIKTGATFGIKDVLTSVLTLTLYKDSVLDLTDCTVVVNMLKPDGTKIVHRAEVVEATKGEIAIGMTEQCLSVLGEVVCELVVHSDMQILYSPKFTFEVVDNLFDESGIESSNEYPLLSTLIREVQNLEVSVEQLASMIEIKEEERYMAEEEREANEIDRQNSIADIEDRSDIVISNTNSKIVEMEVEIQKSIGATNSNTQKIDSKVIEVNAKIVEVNDAITHVINQLNAKVLDVDNKVNIEISQVDDKISDMNSVIAALTKKVDNKLLYVDTELVKKMEAIDLLVSNKLNDVDDSLDIKITSIDGVVSNKMANVDNIVNHKMDVVDDLVDLKLNTIDVELQDKLDEVDDRVEGYEAKIVEVDNKIVEIEDIKTSLITNINIKIEDMDIVRTSVIDSTNTKLGEADDKIFEVSLAKENLVNDITLVKGDLISNVNSKLIEVDNKIYQVDARVSEINTIIGEVEQSEVDRVQAELDRANTFDSIVAELEVTQTDIEDIIGMVGGL